MNKQHTLASRFPLSRPTRSANNTGFYHGGVIQSLDHCRLPLEIFTGPDFWFPHTAKHVNDDNDASEWFVKRRNSEELNDILPQLNGDEFFSLGPFCISLGGVWRNRGRLEYFKNLFNYSNAICSLLICSSRLERREFCVSETFKVSHERLRWGSDIYSAHGLRHEHSVINTENMCYWNPLISLIQLASLLPAASVISQVIIKKSCWWNILSSSWFLSRRNSSLCNLIKEK